MLSIPLSVGIYLSSLSSYLGPSQYEHCVKWYTLDDELELLVAVIRMMPHFIETGFEDGRKTYAVWNETTIGENFADRWNTEPKRADAFYAWHGKALSDFEDMRSAVGLDVVISQSRNQFGDRIVDRVMSKRYQILSDARKSQT